MLCINNYIARSFINFIQYNTVILLVVNHNLFKFNSIKNSPREAATTCPSMPFLRDLKMQMEL